MDYFIAVITTVAGLYFHGWLYVRIGGWTDRDLALILAGQDEAKRDYMLSTSPRPVARESGAATWHNGWSGKRRNIACPEKACRPPKTT